MTARTRIKVCGMTEMSEAAAAVDAGVDALGFIFVEKSPRKTDPDRAREIITALPPFVDAVGVFVDEEPEVVNEIIQYCGLTVVQLHGTESPQYCQDVSARVVKVFHVGSNLSRPEQEPYFDPYYEAVSGFLLDTFHEKKAGGTGRTFDWRLTEQMRPPKPFILAGGLTPENVGEAVRTVKPFAVDANSGVEFEPGRKDIAKIQRFVEAVNRADRQLSKS